MKACGRISHLLPFEPQTLNGKDQERAPTPDSACGSEPDWSPPSSSSSTSSSSHRIGNKEYFPEHVFGGTPCLKESRSCSFSGVENCIGKSPSNGTLKRGLQSGCILQSSRKAVADSDADSGIVSISHQSRHIWSTSSSEANQDFTTRGKSFPVLSLPVDTQSSQFDDSLYLTEQHVRRSCRKLFANLYARKDVTCKDLSKPRQPLSVFKNSTNVAHKNQGQTMSVHNHQSRTSSPHSGVRRNHSCDNLHSSHFLRANSSGHRLSLQHPLCDAEDMLKVYARPVSVIPQDSDARYQDRSMIKLVKDDSTEDDDESHFLTNNRHVLQVLPVSKCGSVQRQLEDTLNSSTIKSQQLAMKRTENSVSNESDTQLRTIPVFASGLTRPAMSPKYSHVHSHTFSREENGSERLSSSTGVLRHSVVCGPGGTEVEYAIVDKARKTSNRPALPTSRDAAHVTSQPCLTLQPDIKQEIAKKTIHKSDFALYKSLDSTSTSTSSIASNSGRKSIMNRVQGFGRSAKMALRKAFSTERIYRPQKQELQDEAAAVAAGGTQNTNASNGTDKKRRGTLIKGIRIRMSRKGSTVRKSPAQQTIQALRYESCQNSVWDENDEANGVRREETWGQLLQLNVDGSQVIELNRAPGKPFGFFVARGRVKDTKGVFVSRMQDEATRRQLAGLLDVGDEILEIEAVDVRAADILEVNTLMAKKRTLLLTVLPYICRKDI